MSRSNQTREVLIEALQEVKENLDAGTIDNERSIFMFMSGYIRRREPEIAALLVEVLSKIH